MEPLNQFEHSRRQYLESVAAELKRIQIFAGRCLKEIQAEKLHRDHPDFETYCKTVWGMDQAKVEELIQAADAA